MATSGARRAATSPRRAATIDVLRPGARMKVWLASLLVWLGLCGAPALAQPAAPPLIAWVWPGSVAGADDYLAAFKEGMLSNGLIEGTNYTVEQRHAGGDYTRFPGFMDDLLQRKPAIIMVVTIASVTAAQRATKTVPIVFVSTNDPLGSGLVASLARPGGNTTGLSNQNEDLLPKYIELLRQTLPRATRIALLSNPGNSSNPKMAQRLRDAAASFGINSRTFEASTPAALEDTFSAVATYHPDALLIVPDSLFGDTVAERIAAFALKLKLPTFTQSSVMVRAGNLMSYGTYRRELYRRSADYVRKILAGAKPADLPVEQPTRFELVINAGTARALGLIIPPAVLLRADEVIP